MSPKHWSSVAQRGVKRLAQCSFVLCAAMPLALATEAEQPTLTAVYKAHEVDFFYRSTAAAYPCHELQNRVANVMLAIGARDSIDVRVTGCEFIVEDDQPFEELDRWNSTFENGDQFRNRRPGRDQTAHIRVRLQMPVEVTPEVLAEIDRDRSRRELISRVTRNPAASLNDPIVFAAQRQQVTLSRKVIRLEPKDCYLLEQMAQSIFRELDIRVVKRNFTCDRHSTSRITPQLTVEALLPTGQIVPLPDPEDMKKTAEPASDPASPPAAPDAAPPPMPTPE